jgi:hypothetical protein
MELHVTYLVASFIIKWQFNLSMNDLGVDAEVGNRLIEIKTGGTSSSMRSIREGLMQLAYALKERENATGYLVLSDSRVTKQSIEGEWKRALAVLNADIGKRIVISLEKDGELQGVTRSLDPETQTVIMDAIQKERASSGPLLNRSDAAFVVTKVLINQWLVSGEAVTTAWLTETCGYSYPTVARVIQGLGSLIERLPNRKVRLRYFPDEEYLRMIANSGRARATARYVDASGDQRSPERHLHRLERLDPKGVAIGGVYGARHYFADLDIVGAPRLDISFHARDLGADIDFISTLDPALVRIKDARGPASVVVHQMYQANPLFAKREGGLAWADPVECLLDLHDARLELQAKQLLDFLRATRPKVP